MSEGTPKYRQKWIYDKLVTNPLQTYGEMFTEYLQNFTNISRQTFTKDWNKANEQLNEYQQAIKKEKLKEDIKTEVEASKTLILDKYGRMQIAEQIALGTLKVKGNDEDVKTPNIMERLKALEYLSKIDGDFAPKKLEIDAEINQINITREVIK